MDLEGHHPRLGLGLRQELAEDPDQRIDFGGLGLPERGDDETIAAGHEDRTWGFSFVNDGDNPYAAIRRRRFGRRRSDPISRSAGAPGCRDAGMVARAAA